FPKTLKALGNGTRFAFNVIALMDVSKQRDGENDPPNSSDQKGDAAGVDDGNRNDIIRCKQNDGNGQDKRNCRTDIAKAIAKSRYIIHPFFCRNVNDESIIEQVGPSCT